MQGKYTYLGMKIWEICVKILGKATLTFYTLGVKYKAWKVMSTSLKMSIIRSILYLSKMVLEALWVVWVGWFDEMTFSHKASDFLLKNETWTIL